MGADTRGAVTSARENARRRCDHCGRPRNGAPLAECAPAHSAHSANANASSPGGGDKGEGRGESTREASGRTRTHTARVADARFCDERRTTSESAIAMVRARVRVSDALAKGYSSRSRRSRQTRPTPSVASCAKRLASTRVLGAHRVTSSLAIALDRDACSREREKRIRASKMCGEISAMVVSC